MRASLLQRHCPHAQPSQQSLSTQIFSALRPIKINCIWAASFVDSFWTFQFPYFTPHIQSLHLHFVLQESLIWHTAFLAVNRAQKRWCAGLRKSAVLGAELQESRHCFGTSFTVCRADVLQHRATWYKWYQPWSWIHERGRLAQDRWQWITVRYVASDLVIRCHFSYFCSGTLPADPNRDPGLGCWWTSIVLLLLLLLLLILHINITATSQNGCASPRIRWPKTVHPSSAL